MVVAFGQPDAPPPELSPAAEMAASLRADQHAHAEAAAKLESDRDWASRFDTWRAAHMRGDDYLDSLPEPEPLVGGNILYTGQNAWLAGPPGSFKSFFALDWALSVATGTPWLGRDVKQGDVIYLAGEGLAGLRKRRDAWLHAHRVDKGDLAPHIRYMHAESLVDAETRLLLAEELQCKRRSLFVIDTQARATPGVGENDKDAMDPFIRFVTELAVVYGCTTLTIHHSTKSGSDILRGTGSIMGAADTVLGVGKDDDGDEPTATLTVVKQKDTEDGEKHRFEMVPTLDSLTIANTTGVEEVFGIGYSEKPSDRIWLQMSMLAAITESGQRGMTPFAAERETARKAELAKKRHSGALLSGALAVLVEASLAVEQDGRRLVSTTLGRERLDSYLNEGRDPQ